MDSDTANAIKSLVNMVDHVHSTKSLGGLALNLVLVSVCSQRKNNVLSPPFEQTIEESFAEYDRITSEEPYEKSRKLFIAAREMWEASKPA